MDGLTGSMNEMKLEGTTSGDTEVAPIDDNVSYLGKHLPHILVQHPEWSNPQLYEFLSMRDDFPGDGSITRKALRQKVSKLRKKIDANGGYLMDPLVKDKKLWVYPNEAISASSKGKDQDKTREASVPDDTCRNSSRFKPGNWPARELRKHPNRGKSKERYVPSYLKTLADANREVKAEEIPDPDDPDDPLDRVQNMAESMGGVFAASFLCDEKKGIVAGIKEVSKYLTMIRSDDGQEAARFLHCALWYSNRTGLTGVPLEVRHKLFQSTKEALHITEDDMKICEAVLEEDKSKARNILEKLVHKDKKCVKNGTGKEKSLPYLLLADLYFDGAVGVPRNRKRAEQLYITAAERGNSIAAFKMSRELERRGVEHKVVQEAYMTSVLGDNADSMLALAAMELRKRGNTFDNCKAARRLLRSGAMLNTSVACKERYVREMIGSGDAERVMDDIWWLIVAEDSNACFYGGCQYLSKGELKLADALFRRSKELGLAKVDEYLERVKCMRMSREGKKYKEHIPDNFIQKRPEWVAAREEVINGLANSFSEEFKERTEGCYFDDGEVSDGSDSDDLSLPSRSSNSSLDKLSDDDNDGEDEDEDGDDIEDQEQVVTIRDYSQFNLAKLTSDMLSSLIKHPVSHPCS